MKLSELARRILRQGTDDWVHMAEVGGLALSMLPHASQVEIRRAALAAIRELQSGDYMRLGDLTRDGFVPWAVSPGEALDRVAREWSPVHMPRLGEIGWLESTKAGKELGLAIGK
jgi:hypothetical protein